MRQLVDEQGAVVLSRSCEPYGQSLESAGTAGSNYGFAGEWQDDENNLLYLRARYLGLETGRFISRDFVHSS